MALALVVAGPLLGSGYLMLLDWPSGPEFARPVWFPLPSSGDIGNLAPLNTFHTAARAIHQYLPDKLFLALPIVLGGWGLYRLGRRRLNIGPWGALFGGTLFVVNPFVLDRYLSGQLHIILAYSLLPWAAGPLFDVSKDPARRPALFVGLWLGVLGAIDLHVAALYALLALVIFIAGSGATTKRVIAGATAFGLGLLLWAYWLLPALLDPPGGGIGEADLGIYASRPQGFGVLPALASMYGFWRNEFLGPAQRIPALYLLLLPILGLVILGVVRLLNPAPARRFAIGLAVTGGVALLLAAGTSFPPTAGVFRWLFDHLFFFRIFREPQKFLALVVLAYAVFGAGGFDHLKARLASVPGAALGVVSTLAVVAYGYTMLWGFWGKAE
ncbi:MAG TPA: alpha-(1-_3)-arabinofuranosyltransferase family protein, partial [Actinomycetota bacterium]|nr:alpha-(1->3)-arabinofuranosyltransferase family protein [Actinomycetota bacterium]